MKALRLTCATGPSQRTPREESTRANASSGRASTSENPPGLSTARAMCVAVSISSVARSSDEGRQSLIAPGGVKRDERRTWVTTLSAARATFRKKQFPIYIYETHREVAEKEHPQPQPPPAQPPVLATGPPLRPGAWRTLYAFRGWAPGRMLPARTPARRPWPAAHGARRTAHGARRTAHGARAAQTRRKAPALIFRALGLAAAALAACLSACRLSVTAWRASKSASSRSSRMCAAGSQVSSSTL